MSADGFAVERQNMGRIAGVMLIDIKTVRLAQEFPPVRVDEHLVPQRKSAPQWFLPTPPLRSLNYLDLHRYAPENDAAAATYWPLTLACGTRRYCGPRATGGE
jgi:hypothetical protein